MKIKNNYILLELIETKGISKFSAKKDRLESLSEPILFGEIKHSDDEEYSKGTKIWFSTNGGIEFKEKNLIIIKNTNIIAIE